VHTARARAAAGYDKLAQRGKRALSGDTPDGRGALNGKTTHPRTAKAAR